jgi:exopolyphosphatase/guanosine-5'-triphosphate,3'-diphosphate pyrophosphatase
LFPEKVHVQGAPELQLPATPEIVAVFDIGSNSVKMTVARCRDNGGPDEFAWRTETTRLGTGIDATGHLAPDRMEATLDALTSMSLQARSLGANTLIAVATEATRIAENGPEFLRTIRHETGIDVRTIEGDREAELTFLGLHPAIDRSGRLVLADIGGGSTELLNSRDGEIEWSRSVSVGSGRLTDEFLPDDPPSETQLNRVRSTVRERLGDLPLFAPIDRLVVVGGTSEYLERILPSSWPQTASAIEKTIETLTSISSAELATRIEAHPARARVLPAGVAVVLGLTDLTHPAIVVGAPSGIRSGLLQAICSGDNV